MIYLLSGKETNSIRIVLLEPADMLSMMDDGLLIASPDQTVVVGYAMDPVWLARKVSTAAANDRLDATTLAALLAEAKERAVADRPRPKAGDAIYFKAPEGEKL